MTLAHSNHQAGEVAAMPDAAPVAFNTQVSDLRAWAEQARGAFQIAEMICETEFCPQAYRRKPHAAAAAMLAGSELGFSPMTAINAYDVIQGTPSLKAKTMRAIVQSHGHYIRRTVATPERVVMEGHRKGQPDKLETVEWTIERARIAGYVEKNKANYNGKPIDMLTARCTGELSRLIASDALLGIAYTTEELQDEPTLANSFVSERTTREHAPVTAAALTGAPAAAPAPGPERPAPEKPAPTTISDAQMKRLQAMFSKAGVRDRDARLRVVNALAPRPITSSKDLTQDEADAVIREMVARGQDAIVAMAAPPAEQDPADAEDDAAGPVAADQRDAERDEVAEAYAELDAEQTAAEGEQSTLDDGAGES